MSAYRITYTERFKKHYKKLHHNEKKQIKRKVEMLAENPKHPSLRCKRIQGTNNLFECSVNMDIRIIWFYEDDKLIMLVDVGHHDILNQY
ncbi:MAG TPA: type II toxin-antitoxin system mRNA interferase toxin, RelE/StbE family [Gelria sp.]|jgi:mRNA interferase RelE/StbE|nr:type II toxin-antitoxin system mRNA interferase toxin, RelE/StbE family [Gelria sp.]